MSATTATCAKNLQEDRGGSSSITSFCQILAPGVAFCDHRQVIRPLMVLALLLGGCSTAGTPRGKTAGSLGSRSRCSRSASSGSRSHALRVGLVARKGTTIESWRTAPAPRVPAHSVTTACRPNAERPQPGKARHKHDKHMQLFPRGIILVYTRLVRSSIAERAVVSRKACWR